MRNLIERYVYDVTRRLPEDQREEVKKELTANINDMLGEKPTEAEIETVLLSLGHPRKLAINYREKQRYLIGPEWMDDYLMVLKIVLVIVGILGMFGGMIGALTLPEATTVFGIIAETIGRIISNGIQAVIRGFAIVTLIFMAIEHYHKNRNDEFKLVSLPELPKEGKKVIKRSAIITGMIFQTIFGVLFIYLLATEQFFLFNLDENFHVVVETAILNQAIVDSFIPLFILSLALCLAADAYLLVRNAWNYHTYIVYSVGKVFSTVVTVSFLTQDGLLAESLITKIADVFMVSGAQVEEWVVRFLLLIAILTVIGMTVDLLTTYFKKVRKNK